MERYKEAHRLNVLVICATGYGSAQMLKNRIENELGQLVTIVDLVGYYDLSDERLEGIDAIISSIDLSHLVFTVPVFTVSVFLKSDEVSWIKNQLQMIDASNNQSSQERLEESDDFDSIFSNYFTEDAFFVFENADKEEVLTRLVESVCHDCQKSKWQLLDLINQRESMSTVVFDQDIAVPHPIKAFDERHRVAVAIIKNGLKWDDNFHEIRLVFLVSPSIHQNTGLPVITKRIVDLTDSDNQKQELMSCQTFKAFRQVFLSR
ncbi:PTS sugar transporter subunit IIA [Streptococcus loxodontisalivarius]|uniref:Mannitol/fructose-specific phosphotransferase system IIA component (Ntr-type)/galactitol-specific phosphotransferase system IIB component n=1 Tax=Streptococcus loxodontisalivarius TaxID=1349415 RepID=A0ABS2PS11_9STRE|nr:PTS sugar transporter subunit IIA [Streptococcus loxodontisalivarius]MBM7642716.1 mannitol/fructose-specific phosphotransferase system IIA component (Ntr-type)/galactitol-specific phosphotransferase system IIB component [Streptococcus loxodontisalivarius]